MALVVFFQEDEYVLSVYLNLKILCETAPWLLLISMAMIHNNSLDIKDTK